MEKASADQKSALRRRMQAARDALPASERNRLSEFACRRALELPQVQAARTVALYRAFGSELDAFPLARALAAHGARLAAPVTLRGRRLEFVLVDAGELEQGGAATPEFLARPQRVLACVPSGRTVVRRDEFDVIVVPGLAFDAHGMRLGYGGGFYDRYLATEAGAEGRDSGNRGTRDRDSEGEGSRGRDGDATDGASAHAFTCGICFDCQIASIELPAESHDVQLDAVVTNARTITSAHLNTRPSRYR